MLQVFDILCPGRYCYVSVKLRPFWNPYGTRNGPAGRRHNLKKLTDLFVKKAQAGLQRAEYRDGHTRGLVLRITPSGKKSWAVIYRRKSEGRKRRYTIGAYPAFSLDEARNQAQEVLAAVARREDPAALVQTRNASLTFTQLAMAWVNGHGRPNKVPRALYDDQLMLNREIYPAIGAMKADEVSKRDVIRILDGVADRGARVRSNRIFALLRSIYRWGLAEDLIKSDPTQGVRPRTVERPRDRVFTDEEVSIFWHSLDSAPMTKAVATILRLALVTGQRIGEIAGMTKAEIDLSANNPMWTQVGARRKNKEMTRVPLSPLAVALISDAIAGSGLSPYVFPSPSRENAITAHAATRAISRARPELGLPHFRVHDLRRTVATGMASLGVNPHTISLVLDHISATKGTVTSAVYVKYSFDREKRDALERWTTHLEGLIIRTKPVRKIVRHIT
ncbi:MAG: tyrosine-type recombinase/integrase [Hyphomicrobium sp.]